MRTVFRALLPLCCMAVLALPALAGNASGLPGADIKLLSTAKAGTPVTARFDLKGYTLPVGSYPSINIDFPSAPEGLEPWVRPGYPDTTLTFHTPGTYKMRVILNEVSKPSCGGVNAKQLLEKTIDVVVQP